ncbi:hypothetical protein NIES2100_08330 [Calothrix sp. NIES-2100]|uniref:hypothetical protein n=1 Tax=Calothrix sp. NIES-2100 TaxID=1954172 RepID=UPI000B5F523A|nr:hypothetical protein NIES2100_08330 [Calothrix sp. NIES-2100]
MNYYNQANSLIFRFFASMFLLSGLTSCDPNSLTSRLFPSPTVSTPPVTPSATPTPTGSSSQKDNLLGIWYSQESCPDSDYVMTVRGTTEYLRNESSNFVGEIIISGEDDEQQKVEITYDVVSSGEWVLEQNKLVEKIVDLKSNKKFIKVGAIQVDLNQIDPKELEDLPQIEDLIPKGLSTEYTVVVLDSSKMTLRNDTGSCKGDIEYEKRSRHFQ